MQFNAQYSFSASLALKLCVIGLTAASYLVPVPRTWIERYYSEAFYPVLQGAITSFSNRVPFAVFDVFAPGILVALIAFWWLGLKRAGKGPRLRAVPGLMLNTLALGSAGVLLFLALFGLNYERTPLTQRLDYDQSRVTSQSERQLAVRCVSSLNSLVKQVHAAPWPLKGDWGQRIAPSFQSVVASLGNSQGTTTCQPKTSMFDFYFKAAGFDGFTNPFGLEVILDSGLVPPEVPFILAHEWAHLAGFADESEANFVALLSCLRSDDPAVRYSGWLFVCEHLPSPAFDNKDSVDRPLAFDREVIADLLTISERRRQSVRPWVRARAYVLYDRYLKANRVEAGITSYSLFMQLVLGTTFDDNWSPRLK